MGEGMVKKHIRTTSVVIVMSSSADDTSRRLLEVHRGDSYLYRHSTIKPFLLLLVSLCVHFVSYASVIPLLSFYIFDVITHEHGLNISSKDPCSNTSNDSHHHEEMQIQREVTQLTAPLPFIWFFPGLIPTLLLGPLIDRLGRKVGLLLPMSGMLIKQLIYLVVIWGRFPLWILFIGNGVEGVTGGFAAMLMASFGMVSDLTVPGKQRTLRISIVEATQAIASSVSMVGVGYGIKYIDYIHCVAIALLLNIVNIIFTLSMIPETLEVRKQTPLLMVIKNIRNCFVFYYRRTGDSRQLKMILGIFAFLLTVSVNFSKLGVMSIFLARPNLCWDEVKITIVGSLQIISNWIIILIFMQVVQKLLHLEDRSIGIFGCVSSITACTIMAYANTDLLVYLVVGTSVFMRVTIPMLRSIMSRSVAQDEQGALYAGMGCVEMVCAGVMGMLSLMLYKDTVDSYPATVFIVMAAIMVVVLLIFCCLFVIMRRSEPSLSGYTRLDGRNSDFREIN